MTDTVDHPAAGARPLDGIRVLDAATWIAAPVAAAMLGEFGAEVIKVEKPGTGDPLRAYGSPSGRPNTSLNWLNEGRGKRSITLDLRQPKGAALFKRLAAQTDVVCENFRTGTMERWGLGYEDLRAVNPGIVMLRLTAYGQTGPLKDRVGFARMAHAFGGIGYLAAEPGRPPVNPGPPSLADYMAATYGALGIVLALRDRDRTGQGQVIDLALYEAVFRSLDEVLPAYAMHGRVAQPSGSRTPKATPTGSFSTRDGKWVSLSCTSDRMFHRLARAMGRPELATDPAWATMTARLKIRDRAEELVEAWTRTLDRDELIARCEAYEVPLAPILSIDEIFADPHYNARGTLLRVPDGADGEVVLPAPVPRLSRTPGRVDRPGPRLGEANDEIYRGRLGLGADEMADLKAEGVV